MKSVKISIASLLVIAGGAMPAPGVLFYFDTLAKDYPLDAQWSTLPNVVSVFDVPTLARTDLESELQAGAVGNDMAGKITGVEYMSVYFGGPDNHTNYYATMAVDITGSLSTKGTDPVVKMTLKGTGYSVDVDGSYGPGSSLNLKFTSTRPAAHFHQELTLGSQTRTNDYNDLYGTISGTIKVGDHFTDKLDKESAWLSDAAVGLDTGYIWAIQGSSFVEVWHGSGLQIDIIPLQGQVIQPNTKNAKLSIITSDFSGKGSVNDKNQTYKATLKGVAGVKGVKLNLSGYTGPLVVNYTPTNEAHIYDPVKYPNGYIPNIVARAIKTLTLSGKAAGQKVNQKGVNPDAPLPGNL